ncbi:hypothetical protein [Mycolicibacterium mucogenicum]|uniref:Uncharacterized protein n=1 Tax=Mycolicibacterium mucogenicum DSM 44124 TaxID=1226753 RepID=A0A8H2PFM8_MYCMU|nr:hypothetical protein [Mycolicibacterium mucogenicum]KAB7761769.1 hypothetical protein MMUC44124_00965 [Mycolicibacterium mucogenicum DSM 44124]QPG70002.1 hypothetical protein C1S78_002950 [Mycolicibacterium mucogenicum DSM 44124]
MPTPDIFDFDAEQLACYDQDRIDTILVEQPALYVNHLRIARSLRGWASRMKRDTPSIGDEFRKGYVQALREVAAHLRQGDYVEGGEMIINQQAEESGDED